MKIKTIKINNFLGVEELNYNPGNINVFEGPKGVGKSSILEAVEIALSNNKRRTEIVKHGKEEATLFVELDNGLEIDRRIRTEKADYLKLKQQGKGIKSTESELRKFLSGNIFRPLDFINMKPEKQTEIILSMIKMDYSEEDIYKWFGKDILSGINISKHLLQILKDVEIKTYGERQEINREIKTLEAQVRGIEQELPANYNGEEWKSKKIQEYYNKVSEAEKINKWIMEAINLQEGIQSKIDLINSDSENQKSKVELKYRELGSDCKDIIDLSKNKIEKSKKTIEDSSLKTEFSNQKIEAELNSKIEELKEEYSRIKFNKEQEIVSQIQIENDLIQIQEQKISSKEAELLGLDEKKQLEFEGIEKESIQKIEAEKAKIGKAAEYLENNEEIDVKPLQEQAELVESMREHLREWDRMLNIRNGKLAEKTSYSDSLTNIIDIARSKPGELLKQHKLPIDGIGVDENSLIRINGTLLDGLSDGEKLESAFKIALQRIGELRIMCLDGFEKLNESEQKKIIKLCEDEDIQAFITVTKDTENNEINIKEEL